ncbi:MAG: carboxypeptidase regulatory-like domain-containing protein [Tahibacter sp.]
MLAIAASAQSGSLPPVGASCVVTAGNRNAPLAPDGTYTVFGIPGNLGAIRARATCSDGSVGQSAVGFTDPFQAATVDLGPIQFGHIDPVPIAANLSAPSRFLNTGETSQLHLLAVGADGSSHDATSRSAGTVYAISNDLMATVSEDGLVHIYPQFASGSSARVVVSATAEGSVSSTFMYILGPRGSLTGKVVRADGTSTVAGAQVSVLRLQPMEQAGTAVTGLSGTFSMQDVNAGSFLISAIDPATGDRASGSARIENEGQSVDVTLRLTGQGRVDVSVIDATNAPVTSASVTYTALGANRDTRSIDTNAQGVASFIAVPAGEFTVSTRDPATRLVGTAVASVAVDQTLALTLRLQPIGQIEGVVHDVDGQTLREGVQVRILSRERGILSQSVTAADGAFAFDTLPISDGPFTLDAFVDGRLRARVPGIVISHPNDTVTRNVQFGAVGTVQGVVKDLSGTIYANSRVTMQSLVGLRLNFDALADANGHFVLPAVPVGAFELSAITPQGRSGRAQGSVDADGAVINLDVVLADNTLIGTVFQRDGATPVGAGVTVYLAPRSLGSYYSYASIYAPPPGGIGVLRTQTDAQGRFGFNVPSANSYFIQAEQDLERGRSEVVVVNLNPSQPLEARVVFLAKGSVSGSVRDSAGHVQVDIAVTVHTQGAFSVDRASRTDAQGHYSLDGIFAGDIATIARNETTQLAGVATGRLDNDGQHIDLDVTLAATGDVNGRVLQKDGTVVSTAVRIVAKRNGAQFASLDLPNGQGYQFDLVPVGDIELVAEEIATGDKGVATTRLVSAGESKTIDVRLVGQGTLQVHLVDQAAQPVAGARVTVSTQRPFPSSRELISDTAGNVVFEKVFAGDYSVSASKAAQIGSLSGSASGTLLSGQDQAVNIVMVALAQGRVHGIVFRSDGITPVGAGMVVRMQPEPYTDAYVTHTDAQGAYAFDPVEAGTYNVDALNFYNPQGCPQRDRVRGRATGIAVALPGDDAQGNIQLIGQGQVTGTVTDALGNPMPGIAIRLTNPDPVYGFNVTCSGLTSYDTTTSALGTYALADVPPGNFTITAENVGRTLRAEGLGQVRFDGDAVTLNLSLIDSAVTMPQTFHDANGFPFDITGNGSIGNGHSNIFAGQAPDNGAMRIELISNGVPVPFTNGNGSIGRISQQGQQVEVDDITPSGLKLTRRVYTPRAGYFTRYLEILRNDTAQAISVGVRVKSHHRASQSNPRVVDTSDGDQILSVLNSAAPDRWVVVDDQVDADPFTSGSIAATGHLFDGVGGAFGVASAGYDLIGQTGRLTYTWDNVSVAPGQSVALLHFAFNQLDRYSAREAALRLAQLPPEAIDDLTTDERHAIANFAVPEQSGLAPLPNLDAGIVIGHVYSGDGVTPIPGARVRFKSKHVLFGRERFLISGATGDFRYRSTLDGSAGNYVIPVYAFELSASHPRSGAATALTQSDFDAGHTQETQDLVFINKGDVRGTVKRHNAALVAGANVKLCRFDDPNLCNDEQPNPMNYDVSGDDGRYLMTANPPRDYFLFAAKSHPQSINSGRDLLGRATTTVTAGNTAVADIALEETGSISGIVRSADGTPVVNASVSLSLDVTPQGGTSDPRRGTRSDTAGRYRLFDVPLGSHRVVAEDAISQAQGSADVSVTVDHETVQDITLRGFGAITTHVQFARGVAAANSTVQVPGYAYQQTDTLGVTRFQLPEGQYHLSASHPDNGSSVLFGYADAAIAHSGDQVDVTITLQPAGTVRGTIVRPDASTLADGFPYHISQIRGSGAGERYGSTSNTGGYRVPGLPVGGYLITAYDAQQDRFADAEFSIAEDGEEVVVDLTLLDNRIALPASLLDANRFDFDVQRTGALKVGSGAFGDAGVKLSINGQAYSGDSSARLEASRRQFAITQPTTLSGLTVTRKVYVPRGGYFARYVDVLENHTAAPIAADVDLVSLFAGGGVLNTSSGDSAVTAADRWVIIDDTSDADVMLYPEQMPATAHVYAAANGVGAPDSVGLVTVNGQPRLSEHWSALNVPAGGRVSLLHFAVQQINRAGVQAAVERLGQLPPEMLTDLSDADIASVYNFALPADRVSTLESLPALTASVRGVTYEGDIRTPVRGAKITVQSQHPLFNRIWGKHGDPYVCPSGTPVGTLVSTSSVPGGTQNPPPLGTYSVQGQLTATDSIALPEGVEVRVTAQEATSCYGYYAGHPFTRYPSRVTTLPASATQNVIYDTGVLTGSVVGDANFSITQGRVYRSIDDPDPPFPVFVPIAADATYVYPGLPPGNYDLLFDTRAPDATNADGALRGSRSNVQVTLGQITVTDISMQPTGSVDGAVVTANGEPSRDAQLTLHGDAPGQQYDQCATGCVPDTLAKHRGKRAVDRVVRTDSLGRYKFVTVPNGEYHLTAIDPISGGRRNVDLTVSGGVATVPITLLAVGSANVHVTKPSGASMVDAFVYLKPGTAPEEVVGRTDGLGHVTVANIPQGPYGLRVRDPRYPNAGFMDQHVNGTISTGGQQDNFEVVLLTAAKIAVTVVDGDNGGAAVGSAIITVVDSAGSREIGTTNAQGRLDVSPVLQGAFRVLARVHIGNVDKEAEVSSSVGADDDQVTLPVLIDLHSAQVPLPVNVYDANRNLYNIQTDASGIALSDLQINGVAFTGDTTALQQLARRQYTIAQAVPIAGLSVTRQVFVPRNGYFARTLEILDNPGQTPINVEVKVGTQSSIYWAVRETSSGDAVLDAAGPSPDRWFTIGDAYPANESWAFVSSGEGGALPAPQLAYEFSGSFYGYLASASWTNVTVPAGQRVVLMHFAAQQVNQPGSLASAQRLAQLPPEALEGLEAATLAQIVNFAAPSDGHSVLPELPSLEGSISGLVLEGDGTTPVAGAYVTVRSENPLFNRGWNGNWINTLRADANGLYRVTGTLADNGLSIAIPLDAPLTISADHPRSPAIATATSSFTDGSSSIVQNVLFTGGLIRGSVVGAYLAEPPFSGSVYAYRGNTLEGSGDIGDDGRYLLGGLAAGVDRLEAHLSLNEGSQLRGDVAAVTIGVGQSIQQDITVENNGAVAARVLSGAGIAVPNQYVQLSGTGWSRGTFTDQQGRCAFAGVPVGTQTVRTDDQRTGSTVSATVVVLANQSTSQDLQLPGLGTVTITTKYARGAIAPNVYLTAVSPSIVGERALGATGADASLTAQLAVGPYTIRAHHPLNTSISETAGVVATDGSLNSLTAVLKASANVRVHVVDADAANVPIAGSTVRYKVAGANNWQGQAQTGADGSAMFDNLAEATYALRAQSTDGRITDGTASVDTSVDGQTVEATLPLTSAIDQVGTLSFLNESHLFGLFASAGDHFAVGIGSVQVGQVPGDCPIQAEVYSPSRVRLASGYGYGASNNFAQYNEYGDLRNVVAPATGFYVVAISSQYSYCFASGYRLSLALNANPVPPLQYQNGGSVAGHLYRPDGATIVAGARVRLSVAGQPFLYIERTTGPDGVFRFDNVPLGTVSLASVPLAGSTVQATGSTYLLVTGDTLTKDLILPASTRLNIQAQHADGSTYAESVPFEVRAGFSSFSTWTDSAGHYVYDYIGLLPAIVKMYAPADYSIAGEALVEPADGQTVDVNVRIGAAGLDGTVYDSDGTPKPDTYVYIVRVVGGETIKYGPTDSLGHYAFPALPGGALVDIGVDDYATQVRTNVRKLLVAGESTTADIHLPAHGRVHGKALHDWGGAIQDVGILAEYVYNDAGGWTTSRYASSDSDGNYALEDLPLDRPIHVRANIYIRGIEYVVETNLTLISSDSDRQADFTFDIPGGSVVASIGPADGRPMDGSCRLDLDGVGGYTDQGYRRCDQTSRFDGVPAGPATINVYFYPGGGARPGDVDGLGQGTFLGTIHLTVIDGQSVDARLSLSVVKGVVRYFDGAPVPYPNLYLTDASGTMNPYSDTTQLGEYRFEGIQLGNIVVRAEDNATGLSVEQATTLVDPAVPVVLDLTMPATASIQGSVQAANGDAVPGATTYARSSALAYDRQTQSDDQGHYRFDGVALGDIQLSALHPETQNVATADATLTTNGQILNVDLAFSEPGSVGGLVTLPGGGNAADACVNLWSTAEGAAYSGVYLSTTTDASGQYAFPAAVPGPVVVQALDCSGSPVGMGSTIVSSGAQSTLDVPLGNALPMSVALEDSVSGFRFTIEGGGDLTAERIDTNGNRPFDYGSFALKVGTGYLYYQPAARVAQAGRELLFETNTLAGLHVNRRVYVPEAGGYVRILDTLSNPSLATITAPLVVSGLYADISPILSVAPGSVAAHYALQIPADSGNGNAAAAAAYVFAGSGAHVPDLLTFADHQPGFAWGWAASVPAGQTRSYLHFVIVRNAENSATVQAQAELISSMSLPGMFDGLTPADKASIQNFTVPN